MQLAVQLAVQLAAKLAVQLDVKLAVQATSANCRAHLQLIMISAPFRAANVESDTRLFRIRGSKSEVICSGVSNDMQRFTVYGAVVPA